jgi:hypothetical protein
LFIGCLGKEGVMDASHNPLDVFQLASCLYLCGKPFCDPIINKATEKLAEKPIELGVDALYKGVWKLITKQLGRQPVTPHTLPNALQAHAQHQPAFADELRQVLAPLLQAELQSVVTQLVAVYRQQPPTAQTIIESPLVYSGSATSRITLDPKLPNTDDDNEWTRFHYTSNWLTFVGRTPEQGQIAAYLAHDTSRRLTVWWVLGEGGQGKSRLAAQCCRNAEVQGWKAGFLPEKTALPADWQPDMPTLLVVDYPAKFPDLITQLDTWQSQCSQWSHPVRVLLLERAKDIVPTQSLTPSAKASWHRLQYLPQAPLALAALPKADILTLMRQVLAHRGSDQAFTDEALWDKVELVDPDLTRPLLAAYIADAMADGDNPTTREDLLNTLMGKEAARWLDWLTPHYEDPRTVLAQYQRLIYVVTFMGGGRSDFTNRSSYCPPAAERGRF